MINTLYVEDALNMPTSDDHFVIPLVEELQTCARPCPIPTLTAEELLS